jgi:hypothetical protein
MSIQTNRTSKITTWIFFGILFTYALLRAWLLDPLHDEVATYFHYIETGEIKGGRSLLDANNHLLNSYLGNWIYRLFGTHFFLFRIPAILCFCLYFWSSRKLTRNLNLGIWGEFGFVALNTIPWIFDYFSYTRGYGLAIGFFMAALLQLQMWLKEKHTGHLILLLLFLYLAVFSNLTYLISSLILLCYVFFITLTFAKQLGIKALVFHGFLLLIFCFSLLPLIEFTFALKGAGALYYGSLDGLWWVTGKTLSKYVLFFDANWLRLVYVLLGLVGFTLLFLQWKKDAWIPFISSTSFWLSTLIGGNIVAILFLAKVLKVNYPEDRAAMYLIPLCILALTALFAQNRWIKYLLIGLLFFPISFLWKMNLNTSVFSPDDRMSEAFYRQATKGLQAGETVRVGAIMQLTYSYFERTNKQRKVKHIASVQNEFLPTCDLILTKYAYLNKKTDLAFYQIIAEDPASNYVALRRKKAFQKTILFDSIGKKQQSNAEYILFYDGPIHKEWRHKTIQINTKGFIQTENNLTDFNLVIATNDQADTPFRYNYLNLRWYVGANAGHFKIDFPVAANEFKNEESRLIIYIWNPERKHFTLTNPRIQLLELK